MPKHTLEHLHPALALGKEVAYPTEYDAGILLPIARSLGRASLATPLRNDSTLMTSALLFEGWDMWRGYELSWLDPRGLPRVAILKAWFPHDSTHIIESKSFKLYLNSLNHTRFADVKSLERLITADLSERAGAPVRVAIVSPEQFVNERISEPADICIDNQSIDIEIYQPDAKLLRCDPEQIKSESLFSRLLKSNCPVTGQPDWASLHIQYTGPAIAHDALLRYVVSYRQHEGFHEQCVEQIFCDLMRHCQPTELSVYARYTRRGGMDINPWRATPGMPEPPLDRSAQQ